MSWDVPKWHITLCLDGDVHAFILMGTKLKATPVCGARVTRSPNDTYRGRYTICERCCEGVGSEDAWDRARQESARRDRKA